MPTGWPLPCTARTELMTTPPDPPLSPQRPLPTHFAYGLSSKLLAAVVIALASVPLLTVLAFLVTHPPRLDELGPMLLVILFLLALPVFAILRFGDAFRRFEVQRGQLRVIVPTKTWTLGWRDVRQVVRRSHGFQPSASFKVSLQVEAQQGKMIWLALFDSSLPGAEDLYAQVLGHTPHLRPKELVDERSLLRR